MRAALGAFLIAALGGASPCFGCEGSAADTLVAPLEDFMPPRMIRAIAAAESASVTYYDAIARVKPLEYPTRLLRAEDSDYLRDLFLDPRAYHPWPKDPLKCEYVYDAVYALWSARERIVVKVDLGGGLATFALVNADSESTSVRRRFKSWRVPMRLRPSDEPAASSPE
jgi:hypothetical protein